MIVNNLPIGEIKAGAGDDVIIAGLPEYVRSGERIGDAPASGPSSDPDTRPEAGQDLFLNLDGGADWRHATNGVLTSIGCDIH